jgi:S1-C subfamily serine protease
VTGRGYLKDKAIRPEREERRMNKVKGKIIVLLIVALVAVGAYMIGGAMTRVPDTAAAAPVLYDEDTITTIYNAVSPAVVEIQISQQGVGLFGGSFQEGQGSGFLVDDQGYILTNNHVVSGATDIQVVLDDGTTIDSTVVGTDAIYDLALIKVDASAMSGVTPLELADSSNVKPGQMTIAMGSPFGLNDTITVGIISGVNRNIDGSRGTMNGMLQTDASINPGNSGGPLLNSQGQVIGINTAIEAASGANGIGFAVPSNVATRVLPSLMAGQQVTRPWLGINGVALTPSLASSLNLSVDQGVYIVSLVPDSPAANAGLVAGGVDFNRNPAAGGDVITAADGQAVKTVEELSAYFMTRQVGDTVSLSILRSGQSMDVAVTLAAWPDRISTNIIPQPTPQPDLPLPWGGHFRQQIPVPGY